MLEKENDNPKSDFINVQQNHSGIGNNKFSNIDHYKNELSHAQNEIFYLKKIISDKEQLIALLQQSTPK